MGPSTCFILRYGCRVCIYLGHSVVEWSSPTCIIKSSIFEPGIELGKSAAFRTAGAPLTVTCVATSYLPTKKLPQSQSTTT